MRRGDDPAVFHRRGNEENLRSIEAIAAWCQALQAAAELPQALRKVADRFDADLASVARVDHVVRGADTMSRDATGAKQYRIVSYDRRANLSQDPSGFRVSYATAVCGEYVATSKLGSVWHARRSDFDHVTRLRAPLQQRRLVETVVIPLGHHATCSDFVEMHFAREVPVATLDALALIGPVLADSWKKRAMGLVPTSALSLRAETEGRSDEATAKPILGVSNHYGLSRSEYRVCLFLSRGLNNAALLDELSISLSTLRTHLRNIYAKTGVGSQAELVQLLLVVPTTQASDGTRVRVA